MRLILFVLLGIIMASCTSTHKECGDVLPKGNWEPTTHEALCHIIAHAEPGDYVVFDFDNTLAIGDISDVVFQYQVENLYFRFPSDSFFSVLTSAIPDMDVVLDTAGLTYRSLATRATAHYEALRGLNIDSVRLTKDYLDFRAEMLGLIYYAYTVYGDDAGNLTLFGLMTGMTDEEQKDLACVAADVAKKRNGMSVEYWETEGRRLPVVRGLGITDEMRSLVKALQNAGVRVCICSASSQPMVEAMAEREFGIPAADVFAIRFQNDADGRMLQRYLPDYPVTLKVGKVECINSLISPDGRSPLLVAGDSMGDYAMLTAYEDLRLGLVIDKNQTDDFQSLIKQARQHTGHPYCAQSRNFTERRFVSDGHSVELQ